MLDNGASLPRISSSNESESAQASKPEPMAVDPEPAADDAQPKIPNANKWTVRVLDIYIPQYFPIMELRLYMVLGSSPGSYMFSPRPVSIYELLKLQKK